jgi:hypothetical protein
MSPPPIYRVTFPKFNKNDSSNQKNNNSTSSLSSYVLFNSLFNSPLNINNLLMLFSSVFSYHRSEQHLYPANVFSLLSLLSSFFNSLKVDSTSSNTDFENLILHFTYGFATSSSSFPNTSTDSPTFSKEFAAFYELSLYVFSSSFSHYYSLH